MQALPQAAADPAQIDPGARRRALDPWLAAWLQDGELDPADGLVVQEGGGEVAARRLETMDDRRRPRRRSAVPGGLFEQLAVDECVHR
jgi:hypothetical protein